MLHKQSWLGWSGKGWRKRLLPYVRMKWGWPKNSGRQSKKSPKITASRIWMTTETRKAPCPPRNSHPYEQILEARRKKRKLRVVLSRMSFYPYKPHKTLHCSTTETESNVMWVVFLLIDASQISSITWDLVIKLVPLSPSTTPMTNAQQLLLLSLLQITHHRMMRI